MNDSSTAALPAAISNNTTVWYLNRTIWGVNLTRYTPSWTDVRQAGPRALSKLGFLSVPQEAYQQSIPSTLKTGSMEHSTMFNFLSPALSHALPEQADPVAAASSITLDGARSYSNLFAYFTSRWALSCIVMAVVLNRTVIFAATRRRVRLSFTNRLLLRLIPILLLAAQARTLLQSIQCQTATEFGRLRWANSQQTSDLMFATPNTFLNVVSFFLLFGSSDRQSCEAVRMIPRSQEQTAQNLQGSLSLLWPLFGTFCLSHFIEALTCTIQGFNLTAETGMTLFEHSLAFAEAEAAVGSQLDWGALSKGGQTSGKTAIGINRSAVLTRSMILRRVNTPVEVLIVALLSTMAHLCSQVLGVAGLQNRYRLLCTGFWGLCYMANIVWSMANFDIDDPPSQGLLRYPTVCLLGFVPHVIVLTGIILCALVYIIALTISALNIVSPAIPRPTFRERLAQAHENMQATLSLSEIRISRQMDFYSALLRTGLAAISMASEAVYLNEDGGVGLRSQTWLDDARLQEAETLQRQWMSLRASNTRYDEMQSMGLVPLRQRSLLGANGYDRERALRKLSKVRGEKTFRGGLGANERSSRWLVAIDYIIAINKLLIRVGARILLWILWLLRLRYQPSWLICLARFSKDSRAAEVPSQHQHRRSRDEARQRKTKFELVPENEGLDVEAEFRRIGDLQTAEELDDELYSYWKQGGWWGSADGSGEYVQDTDDEDWDDTSVVSATTSSQLDDERSWESDEDGQVTPTPGSPQLRSREGTPLLDSPLAMRDLAGLLHPTNREEKEEARRLAAHFESNKIVTRRAFRRMQNMERTRILTTPNSKFGLQAHRSVDSHRQRTAQLPLTVDEEEKLLEQLLISKRQAPSRDDISGSATSNNTGLGTDGPYCVVCQTAPRTVIVWPCRCLGLCDDCRVALAMNNFDKCVCCRQEVLSFSRIYVP